MLQVSTPQSASVTELADSEALLIRQVQGRQQAAFRRLYERYLPQVYGLCLRLTGNRQLAEDATQEAFLQVWRRIETFRGESSFSTWLHSLTANSTLSYLRRQKRWWQRLGDQEYFEAVAEQLVDNPATDPGDLMQLLPRLPERARLVFVLHAIEGYRQDQVARLMGTSTGTVKAQFHKASSQLKVWLGDDNGEES
jgi:RNA polymerase sigma-70 factor (ECF subfamily)